MAYVKGTASNYLDLLDKLRTFLTSNADLVAANQQWTQLRWSNNELFVRGPGLDGRQQIYCGIRALTFASLDAYNFGIVSAMSYSDGLPFQGQPGSNPECFVPLWNDSMPYWFVANGQRIIVVAKISTRYMALHLGYGLPWALGGDYPAPLYVGGCTDTSTDRWSSNDYGFRSFADPGNGAQVLSPAGTWLQVRNFHNFANQEWEDDKLNVWPYGGLNQGPVSGSDGASSNVLRSLRNNGDGSYTPFPLIIHGNAPSPEIYMELDGCYYVSGFNNAAETILPIAGVDHLVVPNIFRSDRWGYWLLRLS
ncbi:hypothetical protein [Xanthomonas albilineans]|uniref:Hypothetical phage-related protein n=1 Tax=Xanthomonas albilineans (strain GPE PC73 / CFBP 7063) TaxID=380358 RepID=D2U868_XANAP|nr:hypothetical protein [Xanthomonas albilineans]CBA14770.1 hypothetical phage-related protein [Xanthomonas albilineans GPE PC73]